MAEKKEQTKTEEEKSLQTEILKQMVTLSTSGFGLVAALAWNNLIKEFVDSYINKWFPKGGSLLSLFLYAVIITCLAVLVTYQLSKLLKKIEKK